MHPKAVVPRALCCTRVHPSLALPHASALQAGAGLGWCLWQDFPTGRESGTDPGSAPIARSQAGGKQTALGFVGQAGHSSAEALSISSLGRRFTTELSWCELAEPSFAFVTN